MYEGLGSTLDYTYGHCFKHSNKLVHMISEGSIVKCVGIPFRFLTTSSDSKAHYHNRNYAQFLNMTIVDVSTAPDCIRGVNLMAASCVNLSWAS